MNQHRIARRSALLGVGGILGLALSGCATARPVAPGSSRVTADPHPREVAPADPPAAAAPAAPPLPDVEAIIAAHEGRAPSQWGTDIPGVIRTGGEAGLDPAAVYLTLDACGGSAGSGFDAPLIEGLTAAAVPATLFLNHGWIAANYQLAAALAANPLFSIQNHGTRHLPLSVNGSSAYGIPGTASVREVALEVWENHVALTELTGVAPRWFRPGTAHLDDVALSVSTALGERIAGFAINGDGGATLPAQSVTVAVGAAVGGEIVIAHMNQPGSGTAAGILAAVQQLRDRGLSFGVL
ncbi:MULTISPECIES: polysaccharide deacetylase family protein [unclassified Leucobacter]|uniref:polysaccharide deacetylase family protein n=1 Tax=unclassified Leucobacter TaxID=2621730 RepID=UPI00301A7965